MMFRTALLSFVMLSLAPMAKAEDASILNPSGLPIPRYVSLKSDEVNVRVGPGKRYPIRYVYRRAHLPVQIVEEFAHWRKIKDFEGTTGWTHKSLLDGKRTAMIMDKPQNLYPEPEVSSAPIVRAEPMVIATVKECLPDWCELEIAGTTAWIRKADIWGVDRAEVFEE